MAHPSSTHLGSRSAHHRAPVLRPHSGRQRASLSQKHPLGRICEPAEVASLATWLASDEAAFVSGQPYVIDGALMAGRTFGWA